GAPAWSSGPAGRRSPPSGTCSPTPPGCPEGKRVSTSTRPSRPKQPKIVLTSHPGRHGPKPVAINWGAADPATRGPVIATVSNPAQRNAIGTHSGAYSVYRAVAVAAGALDPLRKPDLTDTSPAE